MEIISHFLQCSANIYRTILGGSRRKQQHSRGCHHPIISHPIYQKGWPLCLFYRGATKRRE